MNYVFQRNPRRYNTPPSSARYFQGDPKKYLPRVPGQAGGSSRPPNTVGAPAPAPEPRIPSWSGRIKRRDRGTDWIGVLNDVADAVSSGRAYAHPSVRKFRLSRSLIEDLAFDAIENVATGQFAADLAAVINFKLGETYGRWTVVRACLGGSMSRRTGSPASNYDPGCLILQAGIGEAVGPIRASWNSVALGRRNRSIPARTDIGFVLQRKGVGSGAFDPTRDRSMTDVRARDQMLEVVSAWLPGLAQPAAKYGYQPPLNRPRVDLDMWPQAKRQGYSLPRVPQINTLDPLPDFVIEPGGITTQPPRTDFPAPPGPRAKERKVTLFSLNNRSTLGRIVGAMGEFGDFVEAFYSTLPDWTKVGDRTVQDKLETLYRHWDKVDVAKAIGNLIANEAEDRFIGEIGKLTARANRRKRFGGAGLEWGPALEGGPMVAFRGL